ncbi:MAG: hypothetical protein B6242_03050 [Anaerolineaceae bacterium 4572_78]|nr:MAG: hypothetical protein B6242_03050 [Anaerolineaceae bacterium 4572_78]
MRRERVSDNIYVFTSSLYAQVTASAIVNRGGIIVIDTLPYPEETLMMINFLHKLGKGRIKYLVNTHWHGDHTFGNYLFDDNVQLICHKKCREEILKSSAQTLRASRVKTPEFKNVVIRVPDVIFEDGDMVVHIGDKSVELRLLPGHTPDTTVAYIREDKVLVASDLMMPVPFFVEGDRHQYRNSLKKIMSYSLESVVQGHGEVLLKGEIPKAVNASVRYLDTVEKKVRKIVDKGKPRSALNRITIDQCGRSRLPLNGMVQDLHRINLHNLYDEFMSDKD